MSSTALAVRSAVDPLLRSLFAAISDEAQLLGSVRRDAQFIMDEMHSMNGFLLHLVGKDHERNHQVRAWMKQVRDLANDTQYCVNLYGRRVGLAPLARGPWGHVRHALFFLQTIPARHQVGKQIRELKSRARDVGERRQKYGVEVPANDTAAGDATATREEESSDAHRRGLVDIQPDILKDGTEELTSWLKKEVGRRAGDREAQAARDDHPSGQQPIVIVIEAPDTVDGGDLAKQVYGHSSLMSLFDCKAWVTIQRPLYLRQILDNLIQQLPRPSPAHQGQGQTQGQGGASSDVEDKMEFQKRLRGRRFLVVVEEADYPYPWDEIKKILDSSGCSPGSAIMFTTKDSWSRVDSLDPAAPAPARPQRDKTRVHSLAHFCFLKADQLIPTEYDDGGKRDSISDILKTCDPDLFCMKLLLGSLHADPSTTSQQLKDLQTGLCSAGAGQSNGSSTFKKHIQMKMMRFRYDRLPLTDRFCLLYLSIFSPDFNIRRTSLIRRWVAEGQVTEKDGREALHRAERCFEHLVSQGFLDITMAGSLGNVITCKVPAFVCDFITEIIREESFGDPSLPPNLARHLSVSSDIQWHQHVLHKKKKKQQQEDSDDITAFLESLPEFSRVAVAQVKVMDLDKCKHLTKQHLKNICNNVPMLKYLSIVKTEISQLPREMKKLQQLETLDIRGTKVPSSATKHLLLPKLKHLLVGPVDYRVDGSPEEELSTVRMPRKIGMMTSMETLVHVKVVEDDEELQHVKNLTRLTHLGVVIHGKQDNVNNLLGVVTELHECLRKLSVWVKSPCNGGDLNMNLHDTEPRRPKELVRLNINGITSGLPNWIKDLPCLAEITLRKTSLSHDSLPQLGKLQSLRCLTLLHGSYTGSILTLVANQFKNMEYLVIEDACDIEKINFETDTGPKLTKIVWTSTHRGTIVGLNKLPSLKWLELNGDFDQSQVRQDVAEHPNCSDLTIKVTTFRDIPMTE